MSESGAEGQQPIENNRLREDDLSDLSLVQLDVYESMRREGKPNINWPVDELNQADPKRLIQILRERHGYDTHGSLGVQSTVLNYDSHLAVALWEYVKHTDIPEGSPAVKVVQATAKGISEAAEKRLQRDSRNSRGLRALWYGADAPGEMQLEAGAESLADCKLVERLIADKLTEDSEPLTIRLFPEK